MGGTFEGWIHLESKLAFVTGATAGIGGASARAIAAAGAMIFVLGGDECGA